MSPGIIRIPHADGQWHDFRMKTRVPYALAVLLAAQAVHAGTVPLSGQVVDESGKVLPDAIVEAGGQVVDADATGRFEIDVDAGQPVLVRLSAPDHYATIHALGPDDLRSGVRDVGPVELVAKRADRRLLLFTGDAMLARRYFKPRAGEPVLARHGNVADDARALLGIIRPYVELADYASVNLETQLSARSLADRLPKSVTFYSPPELANALEWAGFDYVALGNNHTWDYQREGLETTFDALRQTGLGYSGAGFDEESARAAYVADIDGAPFGFLSYVGWAGTFSPSQVAEGNKGGAALGGSRVFAEDVATLPATTPTIIQYHSGLEYAGMPALSERTRLRQAIEDGADVAIGHHAHVLQGLEIFDDRLIAYSMGNFLFDQYIYSTQLGMLLYVWMDGDRLHRAEVVPMHVNGYVPTPATDAMRDSILHRLARLSRPFGTCLRANGRHAVVETCAADDTVDIDLDGAQPGNKPVPLRRLGVSPANPVSFSGSDTAYRLGTDILSRGDFEYSGLFGTHDRAWLLGENVSIDAGESRHLQIVLEPGGHVRTGMRVFDRVFSPSNPTTLSGRVYTEGPVNLQFVLQRRRLDDSLDDALEAGPKKLVGALRIKGAGWHDFAIDFDQPRISTRSVRLLIDIADASSPARGGRVRLDDLVWTEWRTPWLSAGDPVRMDAFGTHVQFRAKP